MTKIENACLNIMHSQDKDMSSNVPGVSDSVRRTRRGMSGL